MKLSQVKQILLALKRKFFFNCSTHINCFFNDFSIINDKLNFERNQHGREGVLSSSMLSGAVLFSLFLVQVEILFPKSTIHLTRFSLLTLVPSSQLWFFPVGSISQSCSQPSHFALSLCPCLFLSNEQKFICILRNSYSLSSLCATSLYSLVVECVKI